MNTLATETPAVTDTDDVGIALYRLTPLMIVGCIGLVAATVTSAGGDALTIACLIATAILVRALAIPVPAALVALWGASIGFNIATMFNHLDMLVK